MKGQVHTEQPPGFDMIARQISSELSRKAVSKITILINTSYSSENQNDAYCSPKDIQAIVDKNIDSVRNLQSAIEEVQRCPAKWSFKLNERKSMTSTQPIDVLSRTRTKLNTYFGLIRYTKPRCKQYSHLSRKKKKN